jgi:hypothetical protein
MRSSLRRPPLWLEVRQTQLSQTQVRTSLWKPQLQTQSCMLWLWWLKFGTDTAHDVQRNWKKSHLLLMPSLTIILDFIIKHFFNIETYKRNYFYIFYYYNKNTLSKLFIKKNRLLTIWYYFFNIEKAKDLIKFYFINK